MPTQIPNLYRFYTQLLDFFQLNVDEQGQVYMKDSKGNRTNYLVEDKIVLLPTTQNLSRHNRDKELIFHPLREMADRGESAFLKSLRNRFNTRINCALLMLIPDLIDIIASEEHRDLSPEQRDLILTVPGADAKLANAFVNLCTKSFTPNMTRFFTNVYLKKAGTIKGTKYSRVGVVQFPFYEFVDKSPELKEPQKEILKQLFAYIFPESDTDPESYYGSSNSLVAPWLESFLRTAAKLAGRVQELQELYSEYLSENENKIEFSLDWEEMTLDGIDVLKKEMLLVPALSGNNGEPENARQAPEPQALVTKSQTAPSGRGAPEPVATSLPVPERVSYEDMRRSTPPPPSPPPYHHAPPPGHYPPHPGYPPHPHYPHGHPPPPPPQEQLVTPEGKLSFDAVLQTNPAIAAGAYAPSPLSAWGAGHNPHQPPPNGPPMLYDQRTGQWVVDQRFVAPASVQGYRGGYQGGYQGGYSSDPYGRRGYHPGFAARDI